MSKKGLYVILDKAAEEVAPVFQANNNLVAERVFTNAIKDSPYLDEFELWTIGYFEIEVAGGELKVNLIENKSKIATDLNVYSKESLRVIKGEEGA